MQRIHLSCGRENAGIDNVETRRRTAVGRKAEFKNPNNLPEICRRHIKVHRYAAIAKSVTIENDHHHHHHHHNHHN
jgi:hypothetical protein